MLCNVLSCGSAQVVLSGWGQERAGYLAMIYVTSKQLKLLLNLECDWITLISPAALVCVGVHGYVLKWGGGGVAVVSQITVSCLAAQWATGAVYSRDGQSMHLFGASQS